MYDKKGLSGVVSIILIVGVSLIVLGIIAAVVFGFVRQGTSQFSARKFTVRLGISSANFDYEEGIATVRVARDLGMGELVGLKFIFEDDRSSESFERRVVGFDELEEKTFDINLIIENSSLVLYKLQKVSVAPIILLDTGEEVIGMLSEVVSGLNRGLNQSEEIIDEEQDTVCYSPSDCGEDYFINGTEYCLGNTVNKYKKVFTCTLGFCDSSLETFVIENCAYQCYDGMCIEQTVECTPATVVIDCGIDGLVGIPVCSQSGTEIIQDYKSYSCVNETCEVTIVSQTIEVCDEGEVCFNAECFVPLECTTHSDCDPGEICVEGTCVTEVSLCSGTINSIWPFSIGEYFDSVSLLDPESQSLVNYFAFLFLKFP